MKEPDRSREDSSSTYYDQPETYQEKLTTENSSRTQRIRCDKVIIEDSFDDGSLIRDTEAGVYSSSQEQHQREQDVVKEENEEEGRRHQDEMTMVNSVPGPILTHAPPSVFATIGKPAWGPIRAHGSGTRESDSSSLQSYSPPRSSEEDLRRSGRNSKSDSESRTLRVRRLHAARKARGAPAAAYVHANVAAGISQEAETAAYPEEIRAPDAPPQDAQVKAQSGAPRTFYRPPRRPSTESLASLPTDCSIKYRSIEFRTEDPGYLSSDGDWSGQYPSLDMEVMDLRPSADPNVRRCSLESISLLNSATVSDLYQVASGGYRNSDSELQAEGGNAPSELSMNHANLILDNLPKHWDQVLGGEESDFVGLESGFFGSSGEGDGGNKVDPLGESELTCSTPLTLLRRGSSHAQGDNDGNGNKTLKRRTSVDIVDTSMSGIWSTMMDSHSEGSGSATSSKSSESMKAKKHRRHFTWMCARAMVGVMALAALSGIVLFIVGEENSFADHRLFERLFGSSLKEQQEENHDEESHKNARDLLRHRRQRKNREDQQQRLHPREEQLQGHGKGGTDGARRRVILQEVQGDVYYPIYQDNQPHAQQDYVPSLHQANYGQEDNPLHQDNNPFDQQVWAEQENNHRRALVQEGYLVPQETPPFNREEASWHNHEQTPVENDFLFVWNDHEELNYDY
jgi:hypothetical protein